MTDQTPPKVPEHLLVYQLAEELNVEPELIWGIAQRLGVGTHLTRQGGFKLGGSQQGGFVFTLEEAERVRATVRMLLKEHDEEGPS
jgi:hypothetical protein